MANMTIHQAKRYLRLTCSLGQDVLVPYLIAGSESIDEMFHYDIECFSFNTDITAKDLLGKKICLHINDKSNQTPRYVHGIVESFNYISTQLRKGRTYQITLKPWLWLLTQTRDCRVFQNESALSIAEKLFKELGHTDFQISDVSGSSKKLEYCVQYNETAYDFITRILAQEGIFYYFKHEKDRHLLILGNQSKAFKKCENYSVNFLSDISSHDQIHSWHPHYRFTPGKYAQTDYNFEKPTSNLLTKSKSVISLSQNQNFELFDYPGLYLENSDGEKIVKRKIQHTESHHETIKGSSNCFSFAAGLTFQLKSSLSEIAQSGDYILTKLHLKGTDFSQLSGFIFSEQGNQTFSNEFECIPNNAEYVPQHDIPKPRIFGLQTATVTGPSGEEIFVDKYGRIKVQFHWDRRGKNDDKSSCWIRVAQQIAGKQWGHHFHPRIGQEVIISFLDGDPDKPIVIGSAYNGTNMPPYELPSHASQSGIKTHSTKDGSAKDANELRFEDKKDNEEIYVHAQKDFNTIIENDETRDVKHDQTETVKNNRTVTIEEGNDSLTVKQGNRSIEITTGNDEWNIKQGNRTVAIDMGNDSLAVKTGNHSVSVNMGKSSITAMQSIELKVGQNSIKIDQTGVTIQGMMVKIQANTIAQVSGSAMLELKGGITMIN